MRDFSLSVREGEFVCRVGHSGCGKSTVLSIVAGLNSTSSGAVILAGREVDGPGIDRGMVFRAPCLLPWKTALGNVLLAVDRKYPSEPRARRRARAEEMLVRVGLGDALDRRPGELSAGMRQRVGLARAFVLGPKLLLLDEPFGMLDSLSRFELQEAFLELWARVLEFLEAGGDAPPPLRVPAEKALEEAL